MGSSFKRRGGKLSRVGEFLPLVARLVIAMSVITAVVIFIGAFRWTVWVLILTPVISIFVPRYLQGRRDMLRARRIASGLCPYCGYDVRECVDRCSECGRMIPSELDRVLQARGEQGHGAVVENGEESLPGMKTDGTASEDELGGDHD